MTIKQQFENGFVFFMWNGEPSESIVDAETIYIRDETARRAVSRMLGDRCALPKACDYPALYYYDNKYGDGFVEMTPFGAIIRSITELKK